MAAKHYSQPWVKLMKGMKQAFPEGTSPRVYPSAPKIQAFTRDFTPGVQGPIIGPKGYGTESKNVNPFEAPVYEFYREPKVSNQFQAEAPVYEFRAQGPERVYREPKVSNQFQAEAPVYHFGVEVSRAHQRNKRGRDDEERPRKVSKGHQVILGISRDGRERERERPLNKGGLFKG